jgi:hypothetical protein
MYQPRKDSRREKVLQIVNESGGITAEHILKLHGTMGFLNVWAITTELRKLARYRCINQIGNVFFSVEQEKPVYKADPKDLVPPREAMPFTPLKTFPPTISPRGQAIERRHFKTCKSNVRFQRENDL